MSQQRGRAATPYYVPPAPQKQTTSSTPAVSRTASSGPSATSPASSTGVQHHTPNLIGRWWQQMRKTLRGQFTVIAAVSMLLSIALALFASQSFSRSSDDLNTIAYGSIPSVDASQAIAQYVDDIDAKSADFLGTAAINDTPSPCSVPSAGQPISVGNQQVYQCDKRTIDAELLLANQQLFNAAHNVTYPGERTAVERITEGLEEYSGYLAVQVHEFNLATKKDASDAHMQAAYQAYLSASNVLHNRIERQPQTATGTFAYSEPANTVPTCQPSYPHGQTLQPGQWATGSMETNINCLSAINHLHLDSAYADTLSFIGGTVILSIIFCLIFCALLLFATVRMLVITHRMLNPGLTLALIASVVFSATSIGVFTSLQGDNGAYGQMVKSDYQSVYDAVLLKRDATNANADESRWLIALEFNDPTEVQHWATDWQANTQQVQTLLTLAQNNQTWVEELQPLADMKTNWNVYYALDAQIRSAANNSSNPQHLYQAEIISTGKSNVAFGNFTNAVDRLKTANYDHYYNTLNTTQSMLSLYILLSAIIFPVIGLIALWGISQRFKDF